MIGIVDVEVQAANPQMPLCPFVAFVGSPSSVRVRNVPGNVGSWNITKVYVSANYPDNSIQSRECTRVGEIYVGTLPACNAVGKGENGFVVSADGVDESGNAVTGYVLGKGDLKILDADGAITPGVTTHYVHGHDAQPANPHEYDIYKDGDTWKIYFNGAWGPLAPTPSLDDTVTRTSANGVKSSGIWSAIWGALASLPTGFTSLYDWCVSQLAGKASKSEVDPILFAQYYPDGSVKSAAEFRDDIKYNLNTTNHTATVKPFCNTGDLENDNSGLVGRVVIPPFVDAQGNPYISDDGTRYKVVGVSNGGPSGANTNLTTIVAPSTMTDIGSGAFISCTSLTSVSLPATASVGETAFFACSAMTSVALPAAMTVGRGAFINCSDLTSITLPVVTNIEQGVFVDCTSLSTVDFGDTPRPSVPSLGTDAFSGVPSSCKIIVPYTQYDAWIAASGWSSLPQEFVRHAEKADKPTTFTTGNLAQFDSNGNLADSEKKPSDFQSALSQTQLDNIAAVPNKADKPATFTAGNLAALDAGGNPTDSTIPAANVALKGEIPYSLGTPTVISTASSETVEGETVYYGEATLANRTANIVQVTAATALDELRITFPSATSGKVRDFGLRVEIGTGSAALAAPAFVPVSPTDETIKIENADGTIPALADGTATAKGVTLLYFSETASGVFVVKGEQVEEVA